MKKQVKKWTSGSRRWWNLSMPLFAVILFAITASWCYAETLQQSLNRELREVYPYVHKRWNAKPGDGFCQDRVIERYIIHGDQVVDRLSSFYDCLESIIGNIDRDIKTVEDIAEHYKTDRKRIPFWKNLITFRTISDRFTNSAIKATEIEEMLHRHQKTLFDKQAVMEGKKTEILNRLTDNINLQTRVVSLENLTIKEYGDIVTYDNHLKNYLNRLENELVKTYITHLGGGKPLNVKKKIIDGETPERLAAKSRYRAMIELLKTKNISRKK